MSTASTAGYSVSGFHSQRVPTKATNPRSGGVLSSGLLKSVAALFVVGLISVSAQCPSTTFSASYTGEDLYNNLLEGRATNPNSGTSTRTVSLNQELNALAVSQGSTPSSDRFVFWYLQDMIGNTSGSELQVDIRIEVIRTFEEDSDITVFLSDGQTSVGIESVDPTGPAGNEMYTAVIEHGTPPRYDGSLHPVYELIPDMNASEITHIRAIWKRDEPGIAFTIQSVFPDATHATAQAATTASLRPDSMISVGLHAAQHDDSIAVKRLSIAVCGEDLGLGQGGPPKAEDLLPACRTPEAAAQAEHNSTNDSSTLLFRTNGGVVKFGQSGTSQDAFLCHGGDQTLVVPSVVAHGDGSFAGDLLVQGANIKATLDFILKRLRRLEDAMFKTGLVDADGR